MTREEERGVERVQNAGQREKLNQYQLETLEDTLIRVEQWFHRALRDGKSVEEGPDRTIKLALFTSSSQTFDNNGVELEIAQVFVEETQVELI